MVKPQEDEFLKNYNHLLDKVKNEANKGIDAHKTIIEKSKDIIVNLNHAKDTAEMEQNLFKQAIESEDTSLAWLSKEKFQSIIVSYSNDEKNYEQLKLLNQQNAKYPSEFAFIAATASTAASGSDVSGNIVFSTLGDIFLDNQLKNEIKSDIDTRLFKKIQFIEGELSSINPEIIGRFNNFYREWLSLSTLDQKTSRLIDLRTIIFDKIFSYNCNKNKGYINTIWFKNQLFPTNLHDSRRYYCIIFFILGSADGKNFPQHVINGIHDRAETLQKYHKKICDLGKTREKPESDNSLETLMFNTVTFFYDCINLRKTFHER